MSDLERRMRAANPSVARRADAVSARAESELRALLGSAPAARQPRSIAPRRARAPWVAAIAAVLVLVTVFVAGSLVGRPEASMAAPPLLTVAPLEGSTGGILRGLAEEAAAVGPSAPTSERVVASEAWSADITVDDDATMEMFVQPQEVTREWDDTLSGRVVATAAAVKWGATSDRAANPGTVLVDEDYGPGQYPAIYVDAPPSTADALRAYLAAPFSLDEQSTAGEWFSAVRDLRADWPLDGAQNAALLEVLAALPDVTVAGTVTDRLGRAGVAVQTETRAGGFFRDILIFDSATGFLIATETVYLGGLDDVSLPAMTVLDYTAWKEAG